MAESLGQIPFGKFKNQDIEDIPDSYLEWIIGEDWFKEKFKNIHTIIKKELEYREKFDMHIQEK